MIYLKSIHYNPQIPHVFKVIRAKKPFDELVALIKPLMDLNPLYIKDSKYNGCAYRQLKAENVYTAGLLRIYDWGRMDFTNRSKASKAFIVSTIDDIIGKETP